ncbi:hypothetical protein [Spirosoma gilvum]
MKRLLLLCLLLANHLVIGQPKPQSSVKAGLTYIKFGAGDLNGINFYNEYIHSNLRRRFVTLATALQLGYGTNVTEVNPGNGFTEVLRSAKASLALDANWFFSVISLKHTKIRVGVGPSLRFISDSHTSSFIIYAQGNNINIPPNVPYVISPLHYDRPHNYFTFGYSLVFDGEWSLNDHWLSGIRASFQNYGGGEKITALGLTVGYQF